MTHLYLVDGTFEIFRCFKATPRASNQSGQEVGAIRGLLQTMVSLLKTDDLTHIAVAFDQIVSRVDPSDKSEDALLRSQFALAADAMRALGITIWPMSRYQADDAIVTGVTMFKSQVDKITMCSSDQDFCQCIDGQRVVLLNRIKKTVQDEAAVVDRYGVLPRQFPTYLGLVGDVSDGIPGIPGFGATNSAKLIRRYDNLESIIDKCEEWRHEVRGGEKLARTLLSRKDEALLYRNLSYRNEKVPLVDEIDRLKWISVNHELLDDMISTIEDDSIMARLRRWDRFTEVSETET
jgi:5'-3' exonuclease